MLASQSARRAELLQQIGLAFVVQAADIDETPAPEEGAANYVLRIALEKAQAGRQYSDSQLPCLGADTAVAIDGAIFGKPRNKSHALEMLARLSGRSHQVMTGVALINAKHESSALSTSTVSFRNISAQEIDAYWRTGEPADKAGAYAIQGRGALFVESLQGSYSGVMGLPLFETAALLRSVGVFSL